MSAVEGVLNLGAFHVGDDVMIRWGRDRWERFAVASTPYVSTAGASIVQLVKASTGEVIVRRVDTPCRRPALPRIGSERFGSPPAVATPAHLAPEACYVCGQSKHPDGGHPYWSNADADRHFRAEDAKTRLRETPEARYVRQHRPY
jgi:hypothetical protein